MREGPLTEVQGCRVGGIDLRSRLKPGPWPAAATRGRCLIVGLLTVLVPITPKGAPKCADDASVREARAHALYRNMNRDPILA